MNATLSATKFILRMWDYKYLFENKIYLKQKQISKSIFYFYYVYISRYNVTVITKLPYFLCLLLNKEYIILQSH